MAIRPIILFSKDWICLTRFEVFSRITNVIVFWDVKLCIVSYVLTDVSEERAASILKVDESLK
jgi:hypothetical protein